MISGIFHVCLIVVFAVVIASACTVDEPQKPPCTKLAYIAKECVFPIEGTNNTRMERQCVKRPYIDVYNTPQFWTGLILLVCIPCGGIIMWRCMRHTKCYKECKDSIRHEHNRACGRCCVKIFPCCTKCCIPYTRPSASELRKERDDASLPYYVQHDQQHKKDGDHHHHHLHLDRRRSECVHPADQCHHHLSHVTSGHDTTTPHSHRDNVEDKTLEEVCVNSVHLS